MPLYFIASFFSMAISIGVPILYSHAMGGFAQQRADRFFGTGLSAALLSGAVLFLLELSAMFLLIADRRAYIYRGDPSTKGWWMVRISNFLVFFLTLAVIYHECTTGIPITQEITRIRLYSKPYEGFPEQECLPTLVLFDALDARIHEDEAKKKDLLYFEYAQIRFDGKILVEGAHKSNLRILPDDSKVTASPGRQYLGYEIEAVRVKDHVLIRISGKRIMEFTIALPDSARFSYLRV